MSNIKAIFFSVINSLKAVTVVLGSVVNESIDYSIIPNGQNEYFQLRYLSEGLIQARVLRNKLDETLESELNILSWLIKVLLLIPNQLENLESASELCEVKIVSMTLSLLLKLSCLFIGLSL